ncbi:protein HEATR9 [Tiliqua scincoides]|uniref:protein HEATR9 n=1 Tax=Tiliqua scincoides TaxID=71010 RepID=UPI0034628724
MGGSKWFPESVFGVKKPQKLKWGLLIERPEDKFARKALERRMPKDSFHQIPRVTYPQPPSTWRTHSPEPPFIQPRIVEQPDPASLRKQCIYRKKLEKEKSKSKKKKSEFLLSKFLKQARPQKKEIYSWNEQLEPERLQILLKYLNSSVELDQLYAAKALGRLGLGEEYVVSALYNTLQECSNPFLEYEVARSLALLGCLEASVVKVLIRHLKDVSLNRREDTLAALKVSLQTWLKSERIYVGACSSLTRNLERLVNLQDPLENISFSSAICLGYLDGSNPVAQEAMFMCLTKSDRKKKMQALVMLVKQMDIVNDLIIVNILEQLQHSPVLKHRTDCTKLLTTIGLGAIQMEGFEEDVFDVLLEKLYEEPFLVVRQSVALAIEALNMKKRAWDIVEKKLKDESEEVRRQAVISLGVLGFRNKNVFFSLLEMLDLDTSEEVRIQIVRTFSSLGMNNVYVRKSLMNKEQTVGILASECTRALKTLDKVSAVQEELMIHPYRTH